MTICHDHWKSNEYKSFISSNRIISEQIRQKTMANYIDERQKSQKALDAIIEQNHKLEYRSLSLKYREKNLEKKIKKREIHSEICSEIMNFVLDLSDVFI